MLRGRVFPATHTTFHGHVRLCIHVHANLEQALRDLVTVLCSGNVLTAFGDI